MTVEDTRYCYIKKTYWAELGQAQLKLDLVFTLVYFYQINEQEISLARLIPTYLMSTSRAIQMKFYMADIRLK